MKSLLVNQGPITCALFIFSILSSVLGLPVCPNEKFLSNGNCCENCAPGFGVLSPCDQDNNTICEACIPGNTFSASSSHEAVCEVCSPCSNNELVKHPCNTTHDTVCECKSNFYRSKDDLSCRQCDLCIKGWGALTPCSSEHNAKCVVCGNSTFSDKYSSVEGCQECTICPEGSRTISKCTWMKDTVCEESIPVTVAIQADATTAFHYFTRQKNVNIVPLYCAILGCVVLGLVGYVLYKKWSFYKIKLQQQKPHRLNNADVLTKEQINQHSKSSTPYLSSLQNQKPGLMDSMPSIHVPLMAMPVGMLYADLPSEKKKEVEKLLGTTRLDHRDWRGLAIELGFTEDDTVNLIKNSNKHLPAEKMLMIWSRREDATLGLLVAALHRIGRTDVLNVIPVYVSLSQIT
ncbi:tumor necrosis factor receptor superfamily member 16-like [Anneissia japonica]|uniref:tumor necrosis factor receptor superfamily member 16-like n=1 Tax=Anneissia japonica TaxID=1529436 RepID=UPI00142572C1|nr:tumor necrosis factor receptor superfamily member 16-like [Anneissia japonica]